MADFLQVLDGRNLLYASTGLAFVTAPFLSPTYNLPLLLFSIYAFERETGNDSLRYTTGLLGISVVFDLIWLIKTKDQNGFIKALSIILMLVKVPTVFSLVTSLRQRGDGFSLGTEGNNTIWSMPGGFGNSQPGGYQALGGDQDDLEQARPQARPPPANQTPLNPNSAHNMPRAAPSGP